MNRYAGERYVSESESGCDLSHRVLWLIALTFAIVLSMSVLGSASASAADGTIVATKGGNRSASNAVSGSTTYADPVDGRHFRVHPG